mmetsp:Transcript_16147/g.29039  ORF Transcript_16147/g.29039 Transcript_16147/m.29039 type:complete len:233 (-) Transcript_16147:100-798(-)|eukprot:CAMPEP_0197532852 /NCGR_PEP_ID=MMETSP1318-20131121/41133_1 /TAXON_ID=552666 /ORGANISM="Partenskyella glossopodia, Strain RCC365" /LENGTH=232 /DNA_ID=CAMNT_0043089521 /DNA_START=36 /DNA_END=734 /DNA_ORIENTATION=-
MEELNAYFPHSQSQSQSPTYSYAHTPSHPQPTPSSPSPSLPARTRINVDESLLRLDSAIGAAAKTADAKVAADANNRDEIGEMMFEIRSSFTTFDSKAKGFLNRKDLKLAMIALVGRKPSKREAIELLELQGIREAHRLDIGANLKDFTAIVLPIMLHQFKDQNHRDIALEVFQSIDITDKGFIDSSDVVYRCKTIDVPITPLLLKEMFAEGDVDSNGKIGFREFQKITAAK